MTADYEEQYSTAAELIRERGPAVVFTGAGISAESGVPTFRGDEGVWKKYPPTMFANIPGLIAAFLLTPSRFRQFIVEALGTFVEARPNSGHIALAEMERAGHISCVITQNVDMLHQEAGSRVVHEIHGNIFRSRCKKCHQNRAMPKAYFSDVLEELESAGSGRLKLLRVLRERFLRCRSCGGRTRPDVVFFGESLPQDSFNKSAQAAKSCDILLVVGTSGLVHPAAQIPAYAAENEAVIIEVNPERSPLTALASIHLPHQSAEALRTLADLL